jgi:cell division protein FtsL
MSAVQEGNRLFKKIAVISLAVFVFLAVIFITAFIIFSRYSNRQLPENVEEIKEEYIGRDFIPEKSVDSAEGVIVSINGNEVSADLEIYKGVDMINAKEVFEKKRVTFSVDFNTVVYKNKKINGKWKKIILELSDLREGDYIEVDSEENLLISDSFKASLIRLKTTNS